MRAVSPLSGLILTLCVLPLGAGASILLEDDFSKPPFVDGALAGQNDWTQTGTPSSLPLQIVGGKVLIPAPETIDNQDCIKSFPTVPPTDATSLSFGFTFTVSSAPARVSSYFVALDEGSPGHFDHFRFAVRQSGANTFKLNTKATGTGLESYVAGADLNYGTEYRVVGVWNFSAGLDTWKVYLNPISSIQSDNTLYTQGSSSGADDPAGFDGAVISQYTDALTPSPALAVGSIRVASSFAELVPEPASALLLAVVAGWQCRRAPRHRSAVPCDECAEHHRDRSDHCIIVIATAKPSAQTAVVRRHSAPS